MPDAKRDAGRDHDEVAAAVKLQRDNRTRARARQAALQRLKEAHPEEYRRFYDEERRNTPLVETRAER